MNRERFEVLKMQVESKVGEPVYFTGNVAMLLKNLDYVLKYTTINEGLREHAIRPADLGFDMAKFWFDKSKVVYRQSHVWEYLQRLEQRKKISLAKRGIHSFSDLLERNFDKPNFGPDRALLY